MEFEILHIDDCPNWVEAGHRLRRALITTGHGGEAVTLRLLRSRDDIAGTAFAGSPTITLDGVDLFPSHGVAADLACRIYKTPSGMAGLPTVDQLVERITTHES